MKRIMITGAGGFIGRNLKEYLQDRYPVLGPPHNKLDLLQEDSVRKYIVQNKVDVIIHCANVGGGRDTVGKENVIYENLRMFFNLTRNSNHFEKMIFFGTGAEYDMRFYKPNMSEDYFDTYIPVDDYGFSKYICSKFIQNSNNIVNLRLFGVFGKYENCYFKFISNAIVKNIFKMPIIINQNVHFDYLYIDDLTTIVEHFINRHNKHKDYNLTRGETIDLLSIANIINEASQFKSKIIIKNKGLNYKYSGSNKRLLNELKSFKFTPIRTAIGQLFSWYQQNINDIDKRKVIKDEYLKYAGVKN